MSLQCSLSSAIWNIQSWSSVDCHARFFLSFKKTNLLGRTYQYLSVLSLALLLLCMFWAQVCLANPTIFRHLLAPCPSLSCSFFPYCLINPLLSLESWWLLFAVFLLLACFSQVFVCHLDLIGIFLCKGMAPSTAAEGFCFAAPPPFVEFKEMSKAKEIWAAG